jgi:hypothetical protein
MMIQHRSKAARPASEDAGTLPSPLRSTVPYATILAAAPLMAAGGAMTRDWAVALAAAAALAGAGASLWGWMQRVMLCDLADRWIAGGAGAPPPDAVVRRRRQELTSPRERRMLATSLRRLVAAAQAPPRVSGRVPTDRRTVTAEAALIERLAAHLADVNTPVEARSTARVHMLVSDAGSPLYRYGRPGREDLHRRLTQVLFEIERGCDR